MDAKQYIEVYGLKNANEVLAGIPDKTATHYVFRKIPNYYSTDFQSWFHDGEWWDSDCHTEQDLIDSYGFDYVVELLALKLAVQSYYEVVLPVYAKPQFTYTVLSGAQVGSVLQLTPQIDDMGDDSNLDHHVSPFCEVRDV
ncbi:hypothetical protein [Acinetobacter phage 4316]|nr:hypothetical protein [Acinetobacter phage 4316]